MKAHSLSVLVLLAAIAVVASVSAEAAAASNADVTVTKVTVSPERVEAGEPVTITATVENTGNTTANVTIVFRVNEAVAESVNVTVAGNETKRVECVVAKEEAGTYTVTVDNKSASFTVTASPTPTPPGEEEFRVGPTVVLRPVVDVIEKGQDGIVELYMDNPALNDVVLHLEARVMVPAGLHIYSEQYAWTTAAGIAYAPAFDIPPGTARTISIHVKADEMARVGQYTLHFSGLYYPGNNKDRYNPLSLTYPLEVKEASMKATPEPGDEDEGVPGFESCIAIAALLATAYLVGRRN